MVWPARSAHVSADGSVSLHTDVCSVFSTRSHSRLSHPVNSVWQVIVLPFLMIRESRLLVITAPPRRTRSSDSGSEKVPYSLLVRGLDPRGRWTQGCWLSVRHFLALRSEGQRKCRLVFPS